MPKRFWRTILITCLLILITTVGVINYIVVSTTSTQLYSDVNLIPRNKVGLLLGTAKYSDKSKHILNPWYQNRIDATVALYMAGKIDHIIVSGDSAAYYNETVLMRADLMAQGIPANKIYADNAGYRTLNSILRCRDVFGEDHFTIISQEFHNQRAIFIANHKRVTAVAYNAADGGWEIGLQVREKLARVKMVLDLVFNKQVTAYGERVTIQ